MEDFKLKTIGYLVFAGFYYLFRLFCPVKTNKVFGVMTHDGSIDGNVGVMLEYLKERDEGFIFHVIKKSDRKQAKNFNLFHGKLSFFIIKPYHLATSRFILLDNVFLPMAYIRFPKKVRVIQLWHGTGTIKRFGQDVNTGRLKKLEKKANSRITHLIVNSEATKKIYAGCFGVTTDLVKVYGLPRTDLLFDQRKMQERMEQFLLQYPKLKGKKLVLYAPTFRDEEKDNPRLALDIEKLSNGLPEDYVFMLRLHPFVMEALKNGGFALPSYENIVSMSSYADINTLLLVSGILITDYSSVIFEYCLMEKPMIFYAYDLEQFSDHGRGFYYNYEEYVPGPVVKDTDAIIDLLKKNEFDRSKIKTFVKRNYRYLDGKSAERLYQNVFKC
jgi:CDP-ribitol ribitolphosphotransferase